MTGPTMIIVLPSSNPEWGGYHRNDYSKYSEHSMLFPNTKIITYFWKGNKKTFPKSKSRFENGFRILTMDPPVVIVLSS